MEELQGEELRDELWGIFQRVYLRIRESRGWPSKEDGLSITDKEVADAVDDLLEKKALDVKLIR